MAKSIRDQLKMLRELDKEIEKIYGDDGKSFMEWLKGKSELENISGSFFDGASTLFTQDFVKIDKRNARALKKIKIKRKFFKKKNFYYTLTPENKAVIFAARVKDETLPLSIPKKLGRHFVAGICELKLNDRYPKRLFSEDLKIDVSKREKRGKKAVFGIMSFPNLTGHEEMEEIIIRGEQEEITVAPTVKVLNSAFLPKARVLRLPSTILYVGPLMATCLEKIEIYDCGKDDEKCFMHPQAFSLCKELSDVTLPDSMIYKDSRHFRANTKLSRVIVPAGVGFIPKLYSNDTRVLKELVVETDSLSEGELHNINAEKAVINIAVSSKFVGKIDDLTLVGNAKELKHVSASVRSLTLPDSVEIICADALRYQHELHSLILPNNVKSIGERAFEGSGIREIKIPDGVSNIEDYAFASCKNLSSASLPESLKSLNYTVFSGCTSLSKLILPDNIGEITPKLTSARMYAIVGRKDGKPERGYLDDLRPLGEKEAIDPLCQINFVYNENTPTAMAVETYLTKIKQNVEKNEETIKRYLDPVENLTVTHENIDHVTASITYLAAVRPKGYPLLLALTRALAEFFVTVTKKTGAEEDFPYCNYFFDTIKTLRTFGQKEAFDLLEPCRANLYSRIIASTKHGLKGEKLLSEDTPKSREKALYELVRAYHIYPRNAPTVIGLIHWFASDPILYNTKATEKLLKILEAYSGDNIGGVDYVKEAKELIEKVKNPKKETFDIILSKEEKRKMYFAEFNINVRQTYGERTPSIPTNEEYFRGLLKKPKRLSMRIDEEFFAEIREEVKGRAVSSFGGTVEQAENMRRERIDAIDAAEAVILPEKRAALEKRLAKRRKEEEQKRRAEEEKFRMEQNRIYTSDGYIPYNGNSYDNDSDDLFPNTFYSYSYNNPYSPITQLTDWARAEAIGIEWDIIDRDYYFDLGIFGDHSL